MPRDASGNVTLAAGNPVVTGSVISSTWANQTLSDIASWGTDSLSRSGKGGMQAALASIDGSKTAPGFTWNNENTSGLYRNAAGDHRYSVTATDVLKLTTSLVTSFTGFAATATATNGVGISGTGLGSGFGVVGLVAGASVPVGTAGVVGAASGNFGGVYGVGSGTGPGVNGVGGATGVGGTFTGGATSGTGVTATGGGGNSAGVLGTGTGTGTGVVGLFAGASATGSAGVVGVGASTAPGVYGNGGAAGAQGVWGQGGSSAGIGVQGVGGTGGGLGGLFQSTAANIDVARVDGYVDLSHATNPGSSVGFTNRVTPKNLVKAWAYFTVTAGDVVTVVDGFNISSITWQNTGFQVNVTLAAAMASANYVAFGCGFSTVPGLLSPAVLAPFTTTTFQLIAAQSLRGAGALLLVLGAQ